MDNICIKKIWEDGELIELYVKIQSQFVMINQTCYISLDDVINNSKIIKKFILSNKQTYVEFGKKSGDFSPAFSLELYPSDDYGHLVIEADMEISDNKTRMHRCRFYITTELGLLEKFAEQLYSINKIEIDRCIHLYDE